MVDFFTGKGRVYYNDRQYQCELYRDEQGRILLDLLVDNDLGLDKGLEDEIPFLSGDLDTGFRFSTIGNEFISSRLLIDQMAFQSTYSFAYLIKGLGGDNISDIKFNEVKFQIADLMHWSSMSAFSLSDIDDLTNSTKTRQVLYKGEDISITYDISASFIPNIGKEIYKDNISLKQNSYISIRSEEGQDINFISSIFKILLKLISFCTLRNFHAEDILASIEIEGMVKDYEIEIGLGSEPGYKNIGKFEPSTYISMKDILYNGSFEEYFENYPRLEPVLDLYILAIEARHISDRLVFLSLCQALETYYYIFVKDKKTILFHILKVLTHTKDVDIFTIDYLGEDFYDRVEKSKQYYKMYRPDINENKIIDKDLSIYNQILFSILDFSILDQLGYKNEYSKRNVLKKRYKV